MLTSSTVGLQALDYGGVKQGGVGVEQVTPVEL